MREAVRKHASSGRLGDGREEREDMRALVNRVKKQAKACRLGKSDRTHLRFRGLGCHDEELCSGVHDIH
jgi:hypothetical protein